MSTTSSSSIYQSKPNINSKDRKRSAHWTDLDTEILVNLLLRYKDSGRTADNGFKPEIWEEASGLLEGNTYMGGPKTADACKSRWQRLQRDYKAAKDMEAMPGFTWDRTTNRLSASAKCWTEAEKQLDSYKYRKIHLPTFDSIAILCTNDPTKARPRASKGRTSLGSISNASSMISLSTQATTSTSNQGQSQSSNNNNGINGHTLNQNQMFQGQGHDPNTSVDSLSQIQVQNDQNVFNWSGATSTSNINPNDSNDNSNGGAEEDGEGEYENAFSLPDGQSFNIGQKRPLPFDPSILSPAINTHPNQGPGPPHNQSIQPHNLPIPQGSPPKKPRQSRSNGIPPNHNIQQPHHMAIQHNQPQHIHQQQQQLPPVHTIPPQQFYLPHTHQHPQLHSHPHQHLHQSNNPQIHPTSATSNLIPIPPRSPEFTTSTSTHTLLDPSIIQTPPPSSHPNSNRTSSVRQFQTSSNDNINTSFTGGNMNNNLLTSSNSLQSLSDEIQFPSPSPNAKSNLERLSESQRRTEAIIQLQAQQDLLNLTDDQLVEVLIEFEKNLNAADTFLAIRKDHLRRLWLKKIVKRRMSSHGNGNGDVGQDGEGGGGVKK